MMGDYKWLRQIGDRRFFLPNMERMYPLSYLQHMSVHRRMEGDLFRFVSGLSLGKLGAKDAYLIGHGNDVFGLFPNLSGLRRNPSACRHLYQSVLES